MFDNRLYHLTALDYRVGLLRCAYVRHEQAGQEQSNAKSGRPCHCPSCP